jgi:hypothetical protein
VARGPGLLETVLLAGPALQELALPFSILIQFSFLSTDGHVHQSVEVRIYHRGEQTLQLPIQAFLELVLFLLIFIHFVWCIAG